MCIEMAAEFLFRLRSNQTGGLLLTNENSPKSMIERGVDIRLISFRDLPHRRSDAPNINFSPNVTIVMFPEILFLMRNQHLLRTRN